MKRTNYPEIINDEDLTKEVAPRLAKSTQPEFFPIIALGGATGSFQSFEQFFLHMPADSGFAFVIVMHFQAELEGEVVALLQRSTAMPIVAVEDGMAVVPDHVYLIPPEKDMGIHNGQLLLFNASCAKGAHMAIDYFLQSLAEDQWNNAVSIIFSGMGADGETGVRMIKEKLGMAMVQLPETAEYSSMPLASIKTGLVDYVLTPEEMPVKLIQYLNHPALRDLPGEALITAGNNHLHLEKILMILRSHTGHDFTLYKKNTITRRIERRIAFHQLSDYSPYVDYIRANPHEAEILFKELLIGVTKFFRDSAAFSAIKSHLNAKLAKKDLDEPVRVWVAGCSTGEEAYSIAMIVMECLDSLKTSKLPKVQIFATDLDVAAIEQARSGCYFSNIISEISAERLERFFVKKNNGYVVKKEVREMIVFAQHNLIKDAPFTKLDLLCCRNVMIYLTAELQKKLMPVFHYALNSGGLLFLGPAESTGALIDAFTQVDRKWKIYERKDGLIGPKKMSDFPFHITNAPVKASKDLSEKPSIKSAVAENFHKILLDHYTPSSLLANCKGDILYINGQMDKFLKVNSGAAVMNIHKMIREELKYVIGNAIHQSCAHKNLVEFKDIMIQDGGITNLIDFSVSYIHDHHLQGLLILTFKDNGPLKKTKSGPRKIDPVKNKAIEELEKELVYTKQQLHTTVEQMETSLEELKSMNEELQSTNEELQSTNEEALTTKEEMQSLNEELMTINFQYQNKAEKLTLLNNDMKNLLDNTEIGTIFLDNQLNILRFTPQVNKLFNVIPSDVGRSIGHIVSNFDYPSIENAIREVIERLNGKELEVKTNKNEWYNLRIMPYRTMDNFINGAVLTFTKITPVKALENKLAVLVNYVQIAVNSLPDAAVILDHERKVIVANSLFLKLFNFREFEVKEQFFLEIVHNRWNTTKLDALLFNGGSDTELYIQHDFQGMGIMRLIVNVQYVSESKFNEHDTVIVTFKQQGREQKRNWQ